MKVLVTFDVDEKNLDDLIVMAKVYRKKDGYKEFVSVENNLPLRSLPKKEERPIKGEDDYNDFCIGYTIGWNECLEEIIGETE